MNNIIRLLFIPMGILYSFSEKDHAVSKSALSAGTLQNKSIPDGIWQARLIRKDGQEIRFNFETRDSGGKKILYIMNGKERLLVDQIRQTRNAVFIQMPFFDSRFALHISRNSRLDGSWIKNSGNRTISMPFHAEWNQRARFPVARQPLFDATGKWSVHFDEENGTLDAVGEFVQSGFRVTGTFLTTTGDYRFLDGVMDGDSLKLSTFDGGHAYYFTARMKGNDTLSAGLFYAGSVHKESWRAERNEQAVLPDEYSLTRLKNSEHAALDFKFRNMAGSMLSIKDSRFRNKVVIIQIMGSWCPNCMDETRFLSHFYDENRERGVEVLALAYERSTRFEASRKSLLAFKTRFRVNYPILITGVTSNDSMKTEKTIPQLDKLLGFPTTLFMDKKGRVRKIATGFNGPGTGDHYEIFKKEFKEQVDSLLRE